MTLRRTFENMGTGDKVGNQHFLLYSQCFLFFDENSYHIRPTFQLLQSKAFADNKVCKGVTPIMHNTHVRNVKKIESSSKMLFVPVE